LWIHETYPEVDNGKAIPQLGTLGGGNGFVEVVVDEEQLVGVVLHSGSRGIGNKIGSFFIERAKRKLRVAATASKIRTWLGSTKARNPSTITCGRSDGARLCAHKPGGHDATCPCGAAFDDVAGVRSPRYSGKLPLQLRFT